MRYISVEGKTLLITPYGGGSETATVAEGIRKTVLKQCEKRFRRAKLQGLGFKLLLDKVWQNTRDPEHDYYQNPEEYLRLMTRAITKYNKVKKP